MIGNYPSIQATATSVSTRALDPTQRDSLCPAPLEKKAAGAPKAESLRAFADSVSRGAAAILPPSPRRVWRLCVSLVGGTAARSALRICGLHHIRRSMSHTPFMVCVRLANFLPCAWPQSGRPVPFLLGAAARPVRVQRKSYVRGPFLASDQRRSRRGWTCQGRRALFSVPL